MSTPCGVSGAPQPPSPQRHLLCRKRAPLHRATAPGRPLPARSEPTGGGVSAGGRETQPPQASLPPPPTHLWQKLIRKQDMFLRNQARNCLFYSPKSRRLICFIKTPRNDSPAWGRVTKSRCSPPWQRAVCSLPAVATTTWPPHSSTPAAWPRPDSMQDKPLEGSLWV